MAASSKLPWVSYASLTPAFSERRLNALARRVGVALPAAYARDLREHGGKILEDAVLRIGRRTTGFGMLAYLAGSACLGLPETKSAGRHLEQLNKQRLERAVRRRAPRGRRKKLPQPLHTDPSSIESLLSKLAAWQPCFPAYAPYAFWPLSTFSGHEIYCLMAKRESSRAPEVVHVDHWAEPDEGHDPVTVIAPSYTRLLRVLRTPRAG